MGLQDANQPWEEPVLTVSLGLSVLLTQSPARTERYGQSLVRTVSHHYCHALVVTADGPSAIGLGTDATVTGLWECVNFRLCVCSYGTQTEALT